MLTKLSVKTTLRILENKLTENDKAFLLEIWNHLTSNMEVFDYIWWLLSIGITIGLVIVMVMAFARIGWTLAKWLVPVGLLLYIIANWV